MCDKHPKLTDCPDIDSHHPHHPHAKPPRDLKPADGDRSSDCRARGPHELQPLSCGRGSGASMSFNSRRAPPPSLQQSRSSRSEDAGAARGVARRAVGAIAVAAHVVGRVAVRAVVAPHRVSSTHHTPHPSHSITPKSTHHTRRCRHPF